MMLYCKLNYRRDISQYDTGVYIKKKLHTDNIYLLSVHLFSFNFKDTLKPVSKRFPFRIRKCIFVIKVINVSLCLVSYP